MDRRPYAIAIVVSVAALAVGGGGLVYSRRQVAAAAEKSVAAGGKGETASCGMALGETAASKLPKDIVLLPSAQEATFAGFATCGHCELQIGESCNTILWDRAGHHIASVLPNERLVELQKETGTCATGETMIVAKGQLTQYRGMNYFLITSFETKS